jgi:putative tryptophan/tyrosine transport system substrate-binding protein
MDRRTFVLVCAVGALSGPLAAQSQQTAGKMYRLGILSPGGTPGASAPSLPNLIPTALRELGYVEGQNLVVERRFADDHFDRLPGLARELVQLRPDVIVAISSQVIQAVRNATATIPIVMVISTDPVARGLVTSLSRPGANVTGITTVAETSLAGKRLELLKEALPKAGRIAVLATGPIASSDQMKEAQKAGEALRVKVVPVEVRDADYDRAFSAIVAGRADAILVLMGPTFVRDRTQIIERAAKHRLPAVSSGPELVEVGGLMSYGNSTHDSAHRAAAYVDKILKGATPSNLPVEQPTKFDLVINLKTAKALGLTLPSSLVKRADTVIQ